MTFNQLHLFDEEMTSVLPVKKSYKYKRPEKRLDLGPDHGPCGRVIWLCYVNDNCPYGPLIDPEFYDGRAGLLMIPDLRKR